MIDLELERDIKRYSTALLDLSTSQNSLDKVNEDMKIISNLLSTVYLSKKDTDDYREFSKKFRVLSNVRQTEIIKQILKDLDISKLVYNFVMLLLVSRNMRIIGLLAKNWDSLFLLYKGYFKVRISSVIPLNEEQTNKIKDVISKKYGNNFFLETKIDLSVLGGLVVFVKNQVIDDSLASKIKKIKSDTKGVI